jgi:ABC-type nitrate/sulfonate/bicarbonate transport system permease component
MRKSQNTKAYKEMGTSAEPGNDRLHANKNVTMIKGVASKSASVVFIVLLLLLWQLVSSAGNIPKYILPSPIDVGVTFIEALPELKGHLLTTLWEAIIGLVLSIIVSFILAVLMDGITIFKQAVYPILIVSQTIPIIALAPLFIIWFGFGIMPKILVVVLVCFFPIVVSLVDGMDSVDIDLLNLMKSMKASKLMIFRHIKLPAAIVSFFSGLRIAVTYSVMGAVIGEWLGGEKGLGVYMMRVKHSYSLDKFFAAILVIVVLSLLLFRIIDVIEFLLMPWKKPVK